MSYDPATVTLEGRRAEVFQMGVKTLEMLADARCVRQAGPSLLGPAAEARSAEFINRRRLSSRFAGREDTAGQPG
jgi:hypothetical protein